MPPRKPWATQNTSHFLQKMAKKWLNFRKQEQVEIETLFHHQ